MIQAGKNIRSSEDALMKIKVEQLYHSLRSPKPEIAAKIRQLRIVRDLDKNQYALQKRQLPYIVCGIFNPSFRRTENFAYTEYFMLDIDNLSSKEMDLQQTRDTLQKDSRVVLCFASPGEDGLKLLFKLKERCYDAGLYSLFYKAFVKKFSEQYDLQQVIDEKTSDVARACFISIDPEAYFNPNADTVDTAAFLDMGNPNSLFGLKHELEKEAKEEKKKQEENQPTDPDKETVARIKALLNPNARKTKEERQVYVPEVLEEIIGELKNYIEQTGAVVTEIKNIQYGKKIHIQIGLKHAEINLFFGKRGFSVVPSPKCGTSEEMNLLGADLISNFLNTYGQ